MAQSDPGFSIDRTGSFEKGLFQGEPIPELGLASIDGGPPASFAGAG
jgi:hypothetical protein